MNDQAKPYQQIIAKCWADEAFKQRLMADPAGTLKQEGIEAPDGVTLNVCENTERMVHIVIPSKSQELSDEQLEGTSAGTCICVCGAGL